MPGLTIILGLIAFSMISATKPADSTTDHSWETAKIVPIAQNGQSKIAKVRIARSVATTYLKPRTSPRIGRGLFEECREGCSYEERREVAESIIEETNEYREEVSENY
eukprot:Seg1852.5 transcript_id=Seg1852.5/GoldUCD/mRNA.D3Y31 product="hypothetical protein" protein_id=Seg1852.5/GoldUCD/D3Y31